jgi:hypothetical protein
MRIRRWLRSTVRKMGPVVPTAVSRDWGDGDGSDMTGRVVAGWGIVDGAGFAVGRNGD